MKPLVLSALLLIVASYASSQTIAPQVINTTGGTYKKGYHILDWSVGELALVNHFVSDNNRFIITNGFLQTNTHDVNAPAPENLFTYDEIRILPNPTYGMVEVNFLTKQQGRIKMQMHDRNGHLMYSREFQLQGYGRFERINMHHFICGTYMLRIELVPDPGFSAKKGVYKIIKLNR